MNAQSDRHLQGTVPLLDEGDLAAQMVAGIRQYLVRLADRQKRERERTLGPLSGDALRERRARLAKILGVVDEREPIESFELVGSFATPAHVATCDACDVYAVRWPALDGIHGDGLLLTPKRTPLARVIAVPDARWTPEMAAGLQPGGSPFGRALALAGCEVIIPTLVSLDVTWSGNPDFAMTNQTHREFVYRMAYELGRHVIGYEIQKLLAVVDLWASTGDARPIGVFGYGEGGLLSLYAGALDPRLDVVGVSGYVGDRFQMWQHPMYRNVWSLLSGFSDAEAAAMIAPRALVVEASAGPVESRPTPIKDRKAGNTAAPGELSEIPLDEVKEEARLTKDVYQAHGAPERFSLIVPRDRKEPGSPEAIGAFLRALGVGQAGAAAPSSYRPAGASASIRLPDADQRQRRHVRELVDFTQKLLQRAPRVRQAFFWDRLDLSSHEAYEASLAAFRTYFWDEVTGRLPGLPEPGPAQSRLVHEADSHRIYEVKLPLDETLFAFGSLLVPKDLGPGERRPVVVCQHGLEDRSSDTYRTDPGHHYYHGYATRFAERGYIVYAPQNPYIGGDAFRRLQRMAHPFGLSLFSFILEQHARTLAWLKELPFVDSDRIAFYGLSYGGVTAMRVTSLLTDYCLSICSANFNEWVMKKAAFDWPGSYLYTNQYEMPDFNLGNTFNYAEMAALIAPRPFMVERGSQDSVGDEEWVSFEFAKVRRHYANLEIADRAKIAHHGGGHVIDGAETFPFIDQELWRDRA